MRRQSNGGSMGGGSMGIGRRKVLSGIVATSAFGLVSSAADAAPQSPTAGSPDPRPEVVVIASGLRLSTAGRAAPTPGETALLSAEVTVDGSELSGSLHGVYLVIDSSGTVGGSAPTSIETHHFEFPDGTIVGTGTASLDDTEDRFVVLGGTGIFAGVRGSYAATQRPLGLGGDGTAVYQFSFLTQQGS